MTPSAVLARPAARGLFDHLAGQPGDALLAVIGMHRADPRPHKIDLGVGVYKDARGQTPVLRAIKAAESRLVASQTTKTYLGTEGDQRFTDLLAVIALGSDLAADRTIVGIQTPGGAGALRLGAELIARAGAGARVWVGEPTWPNHGPIFRDSGLAIRVHPYFDTAHSRMDFDAVIASLRTASAGDIVLLHGCCHNPTGTAFTTDQWRALTALVVERGLIPFIDFAYQGFGDGLEEDASGARMMLAAVPEGLIAYSCDKNFALYRERVGALWVKTRSPATAALARDNMLALARSLWSMPPDHGAAAVRAVIEDPALFADWRAELDEMRNRINGLRARLGAAHPVLAPIARQQGLFALLPIPPAAVADLRERHAIYMPGSGRINIAGLREDSVDAVVAALAPHLPGAAPNAA